jgi:hypothetical protein
MPGETTGLQEHPVSTAQTLSQQPCGQNEKAVNWGSLEAMLAPADSRIKQPDRHKETRSTHTRDQSGGGQAILDRLAKLAPDNAKWRNDLAWFNSQIAELTRTESSPVDR